MGTLCAHLLLQFYIDYIETSLVFWTWSEHIHVVWIYSSDYVSLLFLQVELSQRQNMVALALVKDTRELDVMSAGCTLYLIWKWVAKTRQRQGRNVYDGLKVVDSNISR